MLLITRLRLRPPRGLMDSPDPRASSSSGRCRRSSGRHPASARCWDGAIGGRGRTAPGVPTTITPLLLSQLATTARFASHAADVLPAPRSTRSLVPRNLTLLVDSPLKIGMPASKAGVPSTSMMMQSFLRRALATAGCWRISLMIGVAEAITFPVEALTS